MNPIVLATDGSPAALAATDEAIQLADALGARLVVVGVEHVTIPGYGYYGYGEVYDELITQTHEHLERVVADVSHLAEEAGVGCETFVLKGEPDEVICEIAQKRDARLIVIGSHGWNALRRFVFGSVSTAVLHDAPCPVVVVRDHEARVAEQRVHADAAVI